MGAESNMRGRVIEALAVLHAVAIENGVDAGTPDVNCLAGWIELKQLDGWPVHERTVVRIPKFTQLQRMWLAKRCDRGGHAYLLLRIERDWMLFWGHWAAEHAGRVPRAVLLSNVVAHWPNGLDGLDLVRVLLRAFPGVK